jgi:ATP-binding cassette, subfamily B, heavy metal transporter
MPESPASKPADVAAIRLILPFLWPADDPGLKVRLAASIGILIAIATLNSTVPMLFAAAVDRLQSPVGDMETAVLALILAYGFMHWLARALNEMRWALYGRIEQRIRRRVGLVVFRHLHDLSLRFHLSRRTGQMSRTMDNGMRGIEDLLFDCVFLILPLVAEIVIITGIMLGRYEGVFATVVVCTLGLYIVALVTCSEWLRKHQRRAVVVGADAHGKAVDSLLNYETIKFSGGEDYVAARYDKALAEVETLTVRALTWRSLTGLVQVSVLGIGITLMVVLASRNVAAGTMTIGDFVLVNTYLLQLVRPLDRLGHLYREIKQALVDLEMMMGLLDEKPEIVDPPDAAPLRPGPGVLSFEGVSFAYDDRRPVLDGVSFTVLAGKTLALVGPSGAGKSTIGRLLFRFYDTSAGRILIDGEDIRRVSQASLRAAIAVVPQDSVLFNESILYNIGFGRPEATRADIEEAARLAEIHDFIQSLPDGYESLVGERGLKLSGGEKQRVAIARAVLKRPRIFLFDEATSALDSHTEQSIQDNLLAVSKGTTTLIIAHRLSTVVHAHEILFIQDGRIAERGTHGDLLARDGLYAAMWRRQQRAREAGVAEDADDRAAAVTALGGAGPEPDYGR